MDFKDFVCIIFDPISIEIAKVDMSKNSFYLKGDFLNHHALSTKDINT